MKLGTGAAVPPDACGGDPPPSPADACVFGGLPAPEYELASPAFPFQVDVAQLTPGTAPQRQLPHPNASAG